MAQRMIYHWKHGWIPLDHYAALSKAHGRESGAQLIMGRLNIRPGDGKSTVLEKSLGHKAAEDPAAAHFRMSGPQLKELAGKGDKAAQVELDRRAARKSAAGGKFGGHKKGVPFRPTGAAPKPATPKAVPAKPEPKPVVRGSEEHVAQLNEENRQIEKGLPDGTTISSKNLGDVGRGPVLMDTHYFHNLDTGKLDRVGSVVDRSNALNAGPAGNYEAKMNGQTLGRFPTRAAAHRALSDAHQTQAAEEKRKAAEKALRDAKSAEANRRKAEKAAQQVGNTGGIQWQPHTLTSDGSRYGDAAAAKVKQAFKAGNKTVLIEPAMSQANTQALLKDLATIVDRAQLHHQEVTFHVPTGDSKFRSSSRRGSTGAYVRRGMNTVYINPSVANGKGAEGFGAGGRSAEAGHFMPISKVTPGRQYVIAHELGHVVDNANQHTSQTTHLGSSRLAFDAPREDVTKLLATQQGNLSGYGKRNIAEAYAEAFAQWIHGGPGSSPAADAFAERFGWPTPKTT